MLVKTSQTALRSVHGRAPGRDAGQHFQKDLDDIPMEYYRILENLAHNLVKVDEGIITLGRPTGTRQIIAKC